MTYLITGATGFVGKHLLERLLSRGVPVCALVREGSKRRLLELAAQRAGERTQNLRPLLGDIRQAACGLSDADISSLTGKVTDLFHLAASYDLGASEEMAREANVLGTRNVVDLANRLGARLHHVSSIAVAGDHRGEFNERMFAEGQKLAHPYFATKYEAEACVRRECEVPFRIYRPAIVVGSSKTGEADKVDGPYYAFKLIQRLRYYVPQWVPLVGLEGSRLWLAPVDFVAEAIDCLAHEAGLDGRAFHLVDPASPYLGTALDEFCKAAHAPRFSPRLDRRITALLPGGPLKSLASLPFVRELARETLADFGIPESLLDLKDFHVKFASEETTALLRARGIHCPPLHSYAWKLWDYWERHLDPDLRRAQTIADVLQGKTVLVTGASSGIGRAVAIKVAEAGATCVVVARSVDKLSALAREVAQAGGKALVYPADLGSAEGCDGLLAQLAADGVAVDVLINNAGRSIRRSLDQSYDRFHDFERTMALNYFGALKLIMGLLPGMRARKRGHIINVSSEGVQANAPRFSAYVASKAALDAFSRAAASEVLDDHVHFTTVYMPLVRTPMIAPTKLYDAFPAITPERAADMVLSSLVHRPKVVSTKAGSFVSLAYALSPKLVDRAFSVGARLLPDAPAHGGSERPDASVHSWALAQLVQAVHW